MNETNALQKIEPMPATPTVEAMITLAVERGASVDTIERLMAVRREVRAEQAKEAFDRALAEFQDECPVIPKNKSVPNRDGSVRYRYADLEQIKTTAGPCIKKHGFSYRFTTKTENARMITTCWITHIGGHSEPSEFAVPIENSGRMNQVQESGSSSTYAKRYALANGLGIITSDEDNDGADGKSATKGQKGTTDLPLKSQTTQRQQTTKSEKPGCGTNVPHAELERIVNELMQMRQRGQKWTTDLSGLPPNLHARAKVFEFQQHEPRAKIQVELSQLFQSLVEAGQTRENALRNLWLCSGANASSGLQQSLDSKMVMQGSSPSSAHAVLATEEQRQRWIAELKRRGDWALGYCYDKNWLLPPSGDFPGEPIETLDAKHVPTTKRQAATILAELDSLIPEGQRPAESPQKPAEAPSAGPSELDLKNAPEGEPEPEQGNPDGVETITGRLEQVSVKEGRSAKGPWKKYGIRIGKDFWANTFNAVLGRVAEGDKGHTCTVHFKRGDRGNDLVSIERARKE